VEVRLRYTLEEGGTAPVYQSAGAAGMDLGCSEPFELAPLERRLVSTGLRIEVPTGYEAQVRPRSGLAVRHGLSIVNSPGTIDSDYRGEVKVLLINLGSEAVHFQKGDRIAQLVLCPIARAKLERVDGLEETERGGGGFGSTGR
jgi:dUTP pyrophosphatase